LNGNGPGPFASGAKSKIENPKSKMSPGPVLSVRSADGTVRQVRLGAPAAAPAR
jgi:hypothetical protein